MKVFINLVMNIGINSLPEEGFVYGLTLFFLMFFKVVKFDRKCFWKLLGIAIPLSAIVSDTLRLWIKDVNIVCIIMTLFTVIMVMITQRIGKEKILLTLSSAVLSIIGLVVAEVYIPIYLVKTGLSLSDLEGSASLSFFVSVPERLIEYLSMLAIYFQKLDNVEVKFTELQKRVLAVLATAALVYYLIIERLIYTKTIVICSDTISGLAKIILILSLPLLTAWAYYLFTYFKNRKQIMLQTISDTWNNSREYCKIRVN